MLYLVRHGRTADNAAHRLLGRTDSPLDEVGTRQAEALGRVEALRRASLVVSSPLQRAVATAEALGPRVQIDPRWVEIDYGMFEGRPVGSAPELFAAWTENLRYRPPGGESLDDLGRRVREACEELRSMEQDVVVVSHVSPIKAAVAWALGVGDEVCWRMFLDTASITIVAAGAAGMQLRAYNTTGHLGEA